VALKKYIDGQVENSINGVATIYLANRSEVFMISPYVQLPENYNPSLRPWYELAIKEGFHISDTFLDVESNDTMVSISTKVELEDNTFGVLGIDFNIDL
jgi:methyl-accepting chemotaxis protein